MKRIEISVPDFNDSFSRVVLSGSQYLIRFSYIDTFDYWTFGLYTSLKEPLLVGVKIVPNYPLNLLSSADNMPNGLFCAYTELDRIGKNDFANGKAIFAYVPADQEES